MLCIGSRQPSKASGVLALATESRGVPRGATTAISAEAFAGVSASYGHFGPCVGILCTCILEVIITYHILKNRWASRTGHDTVGECRGWLKVEHRNDSRRGIMVRV